MMSIISIIILTLIHLVGNYSLVSALSVEGENGVSSITNFTEISNDDGEWIRIVPPVDVILKNYNTTEFVTLIRNVTTNITIAQEKLVLTNSMTLVPTVSIAVRITLILFDIFLIILVILLRNYEPIKSKFYISLMLLSINIIGHIQGIIDILPGAALHFETYWNLFISAKLSNQMDALSFYNSNLNSIGIPTWLEKYAQYESIYCFFNSYLIFGCNVAGLSIYSIQIIKLMFLLLLKDKKQAIVKSLEEFKRKQVEKFKTMKLNTNSTNNLSNQHQQQPSSSTAVVVVNNVIGRHSKRILLGESSTDNLMKQQQLDDSSSSTSSAPSNVGILDLASLQKVETSSNLEANLTPRSVRNQDNDESSNVSYEDLALDLTTDDDALSSSYEDFAKKGKFVNFLKKILKYRVLELSYVGFWLIVWYIVVTVVIIDRQPDTWSDLFISWDSYSGHCRNIDRVMIGYYSLIVLFIIFAFIPITLIFDFVTSLIKYVKLRRINKERNQKMENFFIFYFYETDPFVYRTEVLAVLIIDSIVVIAFLLIVPFGTGSSISQELAGSLLIAICLNLIGGALSNPGISILRTIWNYFLSVKAKIATKRRNESEAFSSLQELVSSPISFESIDYILSHRLERDLFYRYLKEEYSIENLLFTEDVTKLRKMNSSHVRAKLLKIKEIVKLYLSESDSVFELNVPSKLIQKELTEYRQLMSMLDELNIKASQLPRIVKESSSTRLFPNIDSNKEESMKHLISHLVKPLIFSGLQTEVYKNLLDSYYRFNNSRKWKEHIKSVSSSP